MPPNKREIPDIEDVEKVLGWLDEYEKSNRPYRYWDPVDVGPYADGVPPPWERAKKTPPKPKRSAPPRKPVPTIKQPPPKFPKREPIHKPRVPMTEADKLMLTELAEAYKTLLTDLVSQDKLPPAIIDRIEEIHRIIGNLPAMYPVRGKL